MPNHVFELVLLFRLTKLGRETGSSLRLLDCAMLGFDLFSEERDDRPSRCGRQQHPMAECSINASSVTSAAIHMNANILTPISALILSWSCAVRAILAATLMTVAMTAAMTRAMLESKPRSDRAREKRRRRIASGVRRRRRALRTAPPMKQPYMTWEPMRRSLRIVMTWEGRAILAPARSSLTRTSTGLNQKNSFGLEQKVTPLLEGLVDVCWKCNIPHILWKAVVPGCSHTHRDILRKSSILQQSKSHAVLSCGLLNLEAASWRRQWG